MEKLTINSRIKLRDGKTMPVIGYSSKEHAYSKVTQKQIFLDAIESGYRYFDVTYYDQCLLPLREAIEKSGVPREEFFVSCNLSNAQSRGASASEMLNEYMEDFGGKLDLVSISWPYYWAVDNFWSGMADYSKEDNGFPEGLQDYYDQGLVAEIGVRNFDIKHLEKMKEYKNFRTLPLVNQNQFHPLYTCKALRDYCKENGIVFVKGFEDNDAVAVKKPLYATDVSMNGELFEVSEREHKANIWNLQRYTMSMAMRQKRENNPQFDMTWRTLRREVVDYDPFDHSVNPREEKDFYKNVSGISQIAEKYGKTNRQIIDRWALQEGAVVLIKGIWKKDMEDGKAIFDFELTQEEMDKINTYNLDKRFGYHPDYIDF